MEELRVNINQKTTITLRPARGFSWPMLGLVASFTIFGILSLTLICPFCDGRVQAESVADSDITVQANTSASTISVSLTELTSIDIVPTTTGTFGAGSTTLAVNASNAGGYSIFLRTEDGEPTLKNTRGDTVNTIVSSRIPSAFTNNTWGYALGKNLDPETALYQTIPTTTNDPVLTVNG